MPTVTLRTRLLFYSKYNFISMNKIVIDIMYSHIIMKPVTLCSKPTNVF